MTVTATLDPDTAARFARVALANVAREFPNKPDHLLLDASDARTPRELHPSFYGSYDWHSCVHMHWLLAALLRRFPDLPEAPRIVATFDEHFAPAAVGAEVAYLARPGTASFERTYGWAWLLKLAHEIDAGEDERFARWSAALTPLAEAFRQRYLEYLPRARFPLRYGMHSNSAFGLLFALDYARTRKYADLTLTCEGTAREWFADDRAAPAEWEPSGADFLSPALVEANLMRRVLGSAGFATWLTHFLPGLAHAEPYTLFMPAEVSDRSDAQIVHLDGLNLSRAWCFREIAAALAEDDPRVGPLVRAADIHLAAGMEGLASSEYVGEHWLASFAMLALTA
jgi:hypothetical protein